MGLGKIFQDIGKWIFHIKDTVITQYPLEEQLIKDKHIIKALSQQVQGMSAQLARVSAIENEKKEAEKSKDYSQEIAVRLKEKENEIKDKRFSHIFSLRHFFNKCGTEKRPSKFGKSVEITDKDDSITFGKFGDILITDNGYIMITDSEGSILTYAKNFTDLIWKPDGLGNYMKRNRIPLAVDEDMNPVPDLEEEEHPDVMWDNEKIDKDDKGNPIFKDKDGKVLKGGYRETEFRKRPVKEMLIEKNEYIRDLQTNLERQEKIIIDMTHNLNTTKQAFRLLENRANLSNAELSGVLEKSIQMENSMGQSHSTIVKLTELKSLHEDMISKKDNIIQKLMSKVESYGDKSMHELVKDEMKDEIEFFSSVLPEKTVIEDKPLPQPAQAGDKLK